MFIALSQLGISDSFQEKICNPICLRKTGELEFRFGSESEIFSSSSHQVPTSGSVWFGGAVNNNFATTTVISYSAMEAIAFLWLNRKRFVYLDCVKLIAVGLLPTFRQLQPFRYLTKTKRVLLVFDNYVFGHMADIVVTAGLYGFPVHVAMTTDGSFEIRFRTNSYDVPADKLTLNHFESRSKVRFGLKTFKAPGNSTHLQQLINNKSS